MDDRAQGNSVWSLPMRLLYHMWLSPSCRLVRLVLGEKGLDYTLKTEMTWVRRADFLKLNPAGEVPVLVDGGGEVLAGAMPISEYLEETVPDPALMPGTARERAEVRRLVAWFEEKFHREVSRPLVHEKLMKRFLRTGQPSTAVIRQALGNLRVHMDYIGHLADHRNYLAGEVLTLADQAAAAHLSVLDYLGDIDWERWEAAKDWYMRVKSRKSFRPLLRDRIAGLSPPPHYDELDF